MSHADFNPEMLALARDVRAMSQSALAQASGLTQAFISKLEHGLILQPSEESIAEIAQAVRFPPVSGRANLETVPRGFRSGN